MNWVDRRFARERHLNDISEVWADLCIAMRSAVASLNEHYRKDNPPVEIMETERSSHFQIQVPVKAGPSIRIDINLDGNKITAAYTNGHNNTRLRIDADHESAYLKQGETRCDPDEASRRILERVFFPETAGGPRSTVII